MQKKDFDRHEQNLLNEIEKLQSDIQTVDRNNKILLEELKDSNEFHKNLKETSVSSSQLKLYEES